MDQSRLFRAGDDTNADANVTLIVRNEFGAFCALRGPRSSRPR